MNVLLKFEADLICTVVSLSKAGDLNKLTFLAHAERVAHISFRLGKVLGLSNSDLFDLTLSSLLHDIGVMTDDEQLQLADLEPEADQIAPHCLQGFKLLKPTKLFGSFALNVLKHHDYYYPNQEIIPAIINVADRVDILLNKSHYSLSQVEALTYYFKTKAGSLFHPQVVDALQSIAKIPSFWLDLEYANYHFTDNKANLKKMLSLDELEELAQLMSTLVDFKSPFTGYHSQGVADVAAFLAIKLNMPEQQVRLLKIAGLLHDLGKLVISDKILMYPGPLSKEQRAIMKQHTYHSYHLIKEIGPQAETLAGWAAFHHERLNGTGYPFGLSAPDLSTEARLMAVADITQSLLETRPYRQGMSKTKVRQILQNNVLAGHIDPDITDVALAHLEQIMELVHHPR